MNIDELKARQKATWELGDFGRIAKHSESAAAEFMARLPLKPGSRVLDVACGTGNLAIHAARRGCITSGIDIASNLIVQARERARNENLSIDFREGDAEALPFPDNSFDFVVTMFGAMFAPRPERAAAELLRVCAPGGLVAMANWTPGGFIGCMFGLVARHVPPPAGVPPPILWGDERTVRERFPGGVAELKLERRFARLHYPLPPAETVDFFRRYFGPTQRAFASLEPDKQEALRRDLIELQTAGNVSRDPNATEIEGEYLEVIAVKAH
jgi:SAM-dependent methyltransferase